MKKLLLIGAALPLIGGVALAKDLQGSDIQVQGEDQSVAICHRDNDPKKPYVLITVDSSAVDGQGKDDHTHHTGPVASTVSQATQLKKDKTKWGDIIPDTLNWDSVGQAVYNNGCQPLPEPDNTPPPTDNGGAQGSGQSTPPVDESLNSNK